MTYNQPSLLIVGVGNEFRNDDGVGRLVARKLKEVFEAVTSGGVTAFGLDGNYSRSDGRSPLTPLKNGAFFEDMPDNSRHSLCIIEHSGEGAALMDMWHDYSHVIIIDAAASGSKPGTIHRIDVNEGKLPPDMQFYSTHDFSVAETIELAKALGSLPDNLVVYAIEGSNFEYGSDLTLKVKKSIDEVIDRIIYDCNTFLS